MSYIGQNILVLGGSGELGSRIVSQFLESGATVVATASSQSSLDRIPAGATSAVVDVKSQASIDEFVQWMNSHCSSIDGVVIACGQVGFGTLETTSSDQMADLMRVNFFGPAATVNGVFPLLKEHVNDKAFVAGISGIVVDQTFPGMSAYTSSKTALAAYLQSIAKEWRRYKIKTIDVRLGHTETGLAGRALFGEAPNMPTGHDPNDVAVRIVKALAAGDGIISDTEFA